MKKLFNAETFLSKMAVLFLAVFLVSIVANAGIPPRDPFVVLRVNGVEYKANAEIKVRSGERIQVEAVLMGGKRDYCSNPQTYANIGKNTVILSQGENGMSFDINQGQFRGDWKLSSEKATFTSGPEVAISPITNGTMQRGANVEFKPGNYQKVFFKANSTTSWHYVKNTPAGRQEENETYTGTATFYFVIEVEDGEWFSSNNVKAVGKEDFSIRNNLDRIQEFYNLIEKAMLAKNWSSAQMQWGNLKNSIGELKSNIEKAQKKDPLFKCDISLMGLPSDLSMNHITDLKIMSEKWKESWQICSNNAQEINKMLLDKKMNFSANILRSVFKNYISWGTSIPTSAPDILTQYDPKGIFTAVDLPRKVMGWYEDAQKDASILNDQAGSIKQMNALLSFYEKRRDNYIEERKAIIGILFELKPVEALHSEMKSYISSAKSVKYVPKEK